MPAAAITAASAMLTSDRRSRLLTRDHLKTTRSARTGIEKVRRGSKFGENARPKGKGTGFNENHPTGSYCWFGDSTSRWQVSTKLLSNESVRNNYNNADIVRSVFFFFRFIHACLSALPTPIFIVADRQHNASGFVGSAATLPCEIDEAHCGRVYLVTWTKLSSTHGHWERVYLFSSSSTVNRVLGPLAHPDRAAFHAGKFNWATPHRLPIKLYTVLTRIRRCDNA